VTRSLRWTLAAAAALSPEALQAIGNLQGVHQGYVRVRGMAPDALH
jgi:hypothetical protein